MLVIRCSYWNGTNSYKKSNTKNLWSKSPVKCSQEKSILKYLPNRPKKTTLMTLIIHIKKLATPLISRKNWKENQNFLSAKNPSRKKTTKMMNFIIVKKNNVEDSKKNNKKDTKKKIKKVIKNHKLPLTMINKFGMKSSPNKSLSPNQSQRKTLQLGNQCLKLLRIPA